jgi:hypothetical protein
MPSIPVLVGLISLYHLYIRTLLTLVRTSGIPVLAGLFSLYHLYISTLLTLVRTSAALCLAVSGQYHRRVRDPRGPARRQ